MRSWSVTLLVLAAVAVAALVSADGEFAEGVVGAGPADGADAAAVANAAPEDDEAVSAAEPAAVKAEADPDDAAESPVPQGGAAPRKNPVPDNVELDDDDEVYEDDEEDFDPRIRSSDSAEVKKLKDKIKFLMEEHKMDTKFQKELVSRLREIQSEMRRMQPSVRDPQLTEWMLRRTENLGSFLASPRIGRALEENLKKLMRRTQRLESELDKDLTRVVGTRYSEPLARFMTLLLLALPAAIIVYGVYRSYVVFSVRQYVLVGHLSNFIFVASSLILYCTLGRDPFGALIDAQHEVGVVLTQLWLALQYFLMLLLLVFALLASKTRYQRVCFLSQIALLVIVGIDYRYRIYLPVVTGASPRATGAAGLIAYLLYTLAVVAMIVITVKTAKVSRNEVLVREVDAVIGLLTCQQDTATDGAAADAVHKEV